MKYVVIALSAVALVGCSSIPDSALRDYGEATKNCSREHQLTSSSGPLGWPVYSLSLKLVCEPHATEEAPSEPVTDEPVT